jgi:Flp pilus assembly secretin CpaC
MKASLVFAASSHGKSTMTARLSLALPAKSLALASLAALVMGAAPAVQTPQAPAAGAAPSMVDPAKSTAEVPPPPKEYAIAIDQTQTLELDRPITTLSIGNPSIADVNIQNGSRLFLLGKSFGRTNILGLDSSGKTVIDMTVFVTAANAGAVTVYKGNKQTTYNCAPKCERALMPGDSKEDFESLSGQIGQKASMAAGRSGE